MLKYFQQKIEIRQVEMRIMNEDLILKGFEQLEKSRGNRYVEIDLTDKSKKILFDFDNKGSPLWTAKGKHSNFKDKFKRHDIIPKDSKINFHRQRYFRSSSF